jgi:hypothetical protein
MDARLRGHVVNKKRQRSAILTAKKVTRWREATAEALLPGTNQPESGDQNGFPLSRE